MANLESGEDEDRVSFEEAPRSALVHSTDTVIPSAERARCSHQGALAGDSIIAIALCSRVILKAFIKINSDWAVWPVHNPSKRFFHVSYKQMC